MVFFLAMLFQNVHRKNFDTYTHTHTPYPTMQTRPRTPPPGSLAALQPQEAKETCWPRASPSLGTRRLRQPPVGPTAGGDSEGPHKVWRLGRRARSPGRSLSAQVARGRRLLSEPRPLDSASYFMTPTCRMGSNGPSACRGSTPCRTYCIRATVSPCTVISTSITTTSSMTLL